MSKIERLVIPVPAEFDPHKHLDALTKQVRSKKGDGWTFVNFTGGKAVFEMVNHVTTVEQTRAGYEVTLRPEEAKPNLGDAIAAKYEDMRPGFYLTKFEPFLRKAELTKLTTDEVRVRGAAAVALGVKPWDVTITAQPDGGYVLGLPNTYMASKHEDKLAEVMLTVAGQVGWRLEVNTAARSARMIPGEPPLFPAAVPYPMSALGGPDADIDRSPVGVTLPVEGVGVGPMVYLDWTDAAFALCGGLPGAGKTVLINSVVAHQRSCGAELVIVDDKSKSVDFEWAKPYVRPGGWGCDSEKQSVAALAMAYEDGDKRASVLREMGLNNWLDMPSGKRFDPITIIVDELSALLVLDPVPKGLPKDNPLVMEINELNYMKQLIGRYITKIVAEKRFVGLRALLSTQITNASTGLPPATRAKIGHKFLQGTNPSKAQRDQMFNDASIVPTVPEHVQQSGKNSRGVGVCDLEGQTPVVYKSLFASVGDYRARFEELGIQVTDHPEPTSAQIAKYAPALDDDAPIVGRADTPSGKPLDPKFGPVETFDADGKRLAGAAAAAAASKQISDGARGRDLFAGSVKTAELPPGPPCPNCGKPINAGCEC